MCFAAAAGMQPAGKEKAMYENFLLYGSRGRDETIVGYDWHMEDPKAVVCIVHGIGEHSGRYERVAGAFAEAGIAAAAIDLKGHGVSYGKRGHCSPRNEILEEVDMMLEWVGKKYGEDVPSVLYGHSMGGNIALDYVARGRYNRDVSAYIISAPWIRLARKVPKGQYEMVKLLAKVCPSFSISSGVKQEDLGDPVSVGEYERDKLVHDRISVSTAFDGFNTGKNIEDGSAFGEDSVTGKPILIMHGTDDRICSIEGTEKAVAHLGDGCEYVRWKGLKHEIHNGGDESNGDEVIEKMVRWIGEMTERI